MLRDSAVAAVVRTCPRATPLAMITMKKSTHGFPFVSHIWDAYGAPLGSLGPPELRYKKMKSASLNFHDSASTTALQTAAEPAVRSAVKILVSQRNDTIKAFFFTANKNKKSAQVPLASTSI